MKKLWKIGYLLKRTLQQFERVLGETNRICSKIAFIYYQQEIGGKVLGINLVENIIKRQSLIRCYEHRVQSKLICFYLFVSTFLALINGTNIKLCFKM